MRVISIALLFLYAGGVFLPVSKVWAEQLPYEAPKFKEYLPQSKPIIPKGYQVKEVIKPREKLKPKPSPSYTSEKYDGISWSNIGVYIPAIWNMVGDITPGIAGRIYAIKNGYLKERIKGDKVTISGKDLRARPAWLKRWGNILRDYNGNIGKVNIRFGKNFYNLLNYYHLKLLNTGMSDLLHGIYTLEAFKETKYVQDQKMFRPQAINTTQTLEKGLEQGKKAVRDAVHITHPETLKAMWWKLTGPAGMVFSSLITTLDYSVGANRDQGWAEYFAALPVDFGLGVSVAGLSGLVAMPTVALFAGALELTLPAITVGLVALFICLILGLFIEKIPVVAWLKKQVHKGLTLIIRKSYYGLRNFFTTLKAGYSKGLKNGKGLMRGGFAPLFLLADPNRQRTGIRFVGKMVSPIIKLGVNISKHVGGTSKQVANWVSSKFK